MITSLLALFSPIAGNLKSVLAAAAFIGLALGGFWLHHHVWQTGYNSAVEVQQEAVRKANAAAQAKEIANQIELAKQAKDTQDAQDKLRQDNDRLTAAISAYRLRQSSAVRCPSDSAAVASGGESLLSGRGATPDPGAPAADPIAVCASIARERDEIAISNNACLGWARIVREENLKD